MFHRWIYDRNELDEDSYHYCSVSKAERDEDQYRKKKGEIKVNNIGDNLIFILSATDHVSWLSSPFEHSLQFHISFIWIDYADIATDSSTTKYLVSSMYQILQIW